MPKAWVGYIWGEFYSFLLILDITKLLTRIHLLQPDRVMESSNNNDLQLIVRAHGYIMDAFECFSQWHLSTLLSATNYCGNSWFLMLAVTDASSYVAKQMDTQQWRERQKMKRLSGWSISKWAESIATAAKKVRQGQPEKIIGEMALQKLQRSADVNLSKEMAEIWAERRRKATAVKEVEAYI